MTQVSWTVLNLQGMVASVVAEDTEKRKVNPKRVKLEMLKSALPGRSPAK